MMRDIDIHRIFTVATVLFFAAGCGGDGGGDAASGGESAAAESPVDAATAGHISGSISFTGDAPAPGSVDMSSEPTCQEKYSGAGPTDEVVMVNDDGGLKNVFVHVREGLGDLSFPVPQEPVVIDQDGCRYTPHVAAVQTGQPLTFRNSDGLLHNINASPSENRGFNISQPVDMETDRTFNTPEVMIPVRCDVHGWMSAYVAVVDHPYHAVSGDDGSFDLSTLPPGDYVIEAWHERYGTVSQEVTVATGETASVTFEFNEGMAAAARPPLGAPIDPHGSHASDVLAGSTDGNSHGHAGQSGAGLE